MAPNVLQVMSGIVLLLAVPVTVYILDRSASMVALSLVSVGLVAVSLYLMFGPAEAPGHHDGTH
jgi:hypothetical protein